MGVIYSCKSQIAKIYKNKKRGIEMNRYAVEKIKKSEYDFSISDIRFFLEEQDAREYYNKVKNNADSENVVETKLVDLVNGKLLDITTIGGKEYAKAI